MPARETRPGPRAVRALLACACALLLAVTPRAPAQDAADATRDAPAQDVAPPAPHSASELFAAFAKIDGLSARFVEEKRLALLAAPLVSKGRLYFLRPGYLARVVEQPRPATLVITPEQVRMTGPDGTETIDLRQSDVVRGFVTSLVQVFSGDERELQRSYDVTFVEHAAGEASGDGGAAAGDTQRAGDAASSAGGDASGETAASDADTPPAKSGWTLTLTPKGEPLTRLLGKLELHGDGVVVRSIVVHEANGDRSTMRLSDVDPAHRFTDDERAALFGPAPAR
ncbi:MAG: outer membrane lipoprotein carrier protein LolA [Planctomycetes bacterium]|nr:outer membrane lipoprotein carrier protein LolA [Planctomycetota bacterium]